MVSRQRRDPEHPGRLRMTQMAPSDRAHPFQEWLQAIADLSRAIARGADDAERGRLRAEIDRTRRAVGAPQT